MADEFATRATTPLAARAAELSLMVDRVNGVVIAILMALLVLDVWLGVVARYFLHAQIPWTETLARYLMIWAALLAISSGIANREHIGFHLLLSALPHFIQKTLLVMFDVLAFLFFMFLFAYGLGMTRTGMGQQAMIFGMSMALPFAAVPVACALAALQVALVGIRDAGRLWHLEERTPS